MRQDVAWTVFDTKTSRWLIADILLSSLTWSARFEQATLFPTRDAVVRAAEACCKAEVETDLFGRFQLQKVVATWTIAEREVFRL